MSISIRKATAEDAVAIKVVDTVVPYDSSRAAYIDEWLEQDIVLVAELNSKVVGYGVFNHAFFRQSQVDMLMVDTNYRGQRVGEFLLLELEKLCDTPKFWITTNLSNHRMQRLLTRLKYRPCGYIGELDPGDPEIVFVKDMPSG